jgi:hypothetical protein
MAELHVYWLERYVAVTPHRSGCLYLSVPRWVGPMQGWWTGARKFSVERRVPNFNKLVWTFRNNSPEWQSGFNLRFRCRGPWVHRKVQCKRCDLACCPHQVDSDRRFGTSKKHVFSQLWWRFASPQRPERFRSPPLSCPLGTGTSSLGCSGQSMKLATHLKSVERSSTHPKRLLGVVLKRNIGLTTFYLTGCGHILLPSSLYRVLPFCVCFLSNIKLPALGREIRIKHSNLAFVQTRRGRLSPDRCRKIGLKLS